MFSRDWIYTCQSRFYEAKGLGRTLSVETKSAACNSVSPEMSSTIWLILGFRETTGGGVEPSVVASVASHLEQAGRNDELEHLLIGF